MHTLTAGDSCQEQSQFEESEANSYVGLKPASCFLHVLLKRKSAISKDSQEDIIKHPFLYTVYSVTDSFFFIVLSQSLTSLLHVIKNT